MSNKNKNIAIQAAEAVVAATSTKETFVSLQAQVTNLQIDNEKLGNKITNLGSMLEEIGALIAMTKLPSRITLVYAIRNYKVIGALIEAILLVIRRYRNSQ